MIKLLFLFILFFNLLVVINGLNLCGDWTQYKDIKCFKVLEKIGTEEEALANCTQLEQSSTLITIHSKEEQEFLNNLLLKYNNISVDVWIGLKYSDKTYRWIDGTDTNFTNWGTNAVKDGTLTCIQMSLLDRSFGKWTDESCKKTALMVCQKNQELNFKSFRDFMENMTNVIEKQQKSLESQEKVIESQQGQINSLQSEVQGNSQSLIPIGFLYTQLPNQSSPLQLWPQMKWTDVTQQYSGLFFRAEGSGSEPFGQIQQANQSWISDIIGECYPATETDERRFKQQIHLNNNWSTLSPSWALYQLTFYMTSGENRPKNTAIKIWKRIQ